jgi:drug/metabolite transporter (DMT)-like permease
VNRAVPTSYQSPSEPATSKTGSYRGYAYIAAAALFWGTSATLGRAAFTGRLFPGSGIARVDPLILSQARTTFSFLVVLAGLLMLRGPRRLLLPPADLARIAALGLAGVAASNYFYYLAIQRTNVATAIIVQYTAPIWVLAYMVSRRLERATLPKIIAVVLAIVGIALVIGIVGRGKLQLDILGVAAALIAAFSFSFYNIFGHSILERHDRWTVLLFTTMAASLFWIFLNPPGKIAAANYTPAVWMFLFVFAVLSVLLPFTCYFAGLEHLTPTKAIVASCLEPVASILIAAGALHETVRPLQALGMAMVLCAIVVVQHPAPGDKLQAVIDPVD